MRRTGEAEEHRTDREEALAEERRNQNAAVVPHMIGDRPEEDMGCYSAEDTLVEDAERFQGVPPDHHHHSRPRSHHRSHREVVGIVRPGVDKDCCFEGDILAAGDTGLGQVGIGLSIDPGIDPREGIVGCTSSEVI